MYSRNEVTTALENSGVNKNKVFMSFITNLQTINPYTIYSAEAVDIINTLVYTKESFDDIINSMIALYNELLRQAGDTRPMIDVYADIYESELLLETADTCFNHAVLNKKISDQQTSTDIMFELIVLLNLYK